MGRWLSLNEGERCMWSRTARTADHSEKRPWRGRITGMTDIDTIRFLWRYMVHADEQVLAAAQTVPAQNYDQEQGISFGSLPKLLNHARLAQKVWIRRLNGQEAMYVDEPPPPREEFGALWSAVHRDLISFAEALTPEILQKTIRF